MKAVFVCSPSGAYGEINSIIPLARGIQSAGGEVWFLASPLAAVVAREHFPTSVFELTADVERNQSILRRMAKKFRPDLIAFAELYEILRPGRKPGCPLINRWFLQWVADLDCTLVFVDFIAHVPMLRLIADCSTCAARFGARALWSFLERLWVVLPCPLNEPGRVEQRCGIPYRAQALPLRIDDETRTRTRAKFLGHNREENGFLILRTGSTWQTVLAEQRGHDLYEHLGDILAEYLRGLPKPVTLVSVSSRHRISCRSGGFEIRNIANLPPQEFDELALSCDLVLTDNEIGYTLARTLGRVPGLVLINSFHAPDILKREKAGSRLREIVNTMVSRRPNCIYPHKIFPIPADEDEFADSRTEGADSAAVSASHEPKTVRLGRLVSSAFIRAELYGGQDTRRVFEAILCDHGQRVRLKQLEEAFLDRLNRLDDGSSVLKSLAMQDSILEHTVL
jgi:hypothetical protein